MTAATARATSGGRATLNLPSKLRLGARGSKLSRWQVEWVAARLAEAGIAVDIELIKTGGDATSQPIASLGDRGVFTKEIQRAVLEGRVDCAVHSLKDLPTEPVDGLFLGAVPPRENPYDVLVSRRGESLDDLPPAARIGTGSRRRQAQLLHFRHDFVVADIRGNVETRLRKLDDGEYDAILLAAAGLTRLGLVDRVTQVLPPSILLPAVGQGALGIEVRTGDEATHAGLATLNDPPSLAAVTAERAMLAALRGGCLAPVGGWARLADDRLRLDGVVLSLCGTQRLAAMATGPPGDADRIGRDVAEQLLVQGASELIAGARD